MEKYTSGEIAKLCSVSVRTVQYYDSRSLLTPSELSEGGRRLYSVDDLAKMRVICFLRGLGISIDGIKDILSEEHPENLITLLIEEQEKNLKSELEEKTDMLKRIGDLKKAMNIIPEVSGDSIGDLVAVTDSKKSLSRLRMMLLIMALPMNIIEILTLAVSFKTGNFLPFILGMVLVVLIGVFITFFYVRNISYICPECHTVFAPSFREEFFAFHTPNTRRLTCRSCKRKGYCIEIYKRR